MAKNIVIYIDAMIMPDKNAAAQRATAICKSLIDIGKKPVVVGLTTEIDKKTTILDSYKNYNGIDCYAVKYPKSVKEWINRMTTIKPFLEVIDKYGIGNIHSIIAMDYEVIALYRLKKYCQKNNIKLIADSVEWYGKSRLKFPMNIVKDLDTKIRMEYLYPKLDYMICISRYLYENFSPTIPKIVEIPGTIDPLDSKWSKVKPYKGNDILTIGYAGHPGFNFEKERLDWLIRAICELNEEGIKCRLITAGFDKNIVEDNIPYIKNYKYYNSHIIYMGKLTHIDCLNMIASCDFSAIIREDNRVTKAGFPTKLSESFGCKTPVITTKSSNIEDYIIEDNNGYLIPEFSFESTKETIRSISMLSKDKIRNMHENIINPLVYYNYNHKLRSILEDDSQ